MQHKHGLHFNPSTCFTFPLACASVLMVVFFFLYRAFVRANESDNTSPKHHQHKAVKQYALQQELDKIKGVTSNKIADIFRLSAGIAHEIL